MIDANIRQTFLTVMAIAIGAVALLLLSTFFSGTDAKAQASGRDHDKYSYHKNDDKDHRGDRKDHDRKHYSNRDKNDHDWKDDDDCCDRKIKVRYTSSWNYNVCSDDSNWDWDDDDDCDNDHRSSWDHDDDCRDGKNGRHLSYVRYAH